jgi:hypothetical protein
LDFCYWNFRCCKCISQYCYCQHLGLHCLLFYSQYRVQSLFLDKLSCQ